MTAIPKEKIGIQSVSHGKLLFVVNAHEFTAAHRLPLLHAATQYGWNVAAVAPARSPASERLSSAGFKVYEVDLTRRGIRPFQEWKSLIELERLYRKIRPDIVHHATIKPVIYGTIAARRAQVPAVVNAITGLGYVYTDDGIRTRAIRWVVNALYRRFLKHPNQKIIFQNCDDQRILLNIGAVGPGESLLIPGSGVDVDYFVPEPEPDGELLVALVARMLWNKGVGDFAKAARQLKEKGYSARFVLVGGLDQDNPSSIPESRLLGWVKEGIVEWWGHCDDMKAVYLSAHIVVLPSYREGLPKVLLEAAACGRPVVTVDSPGCRDAVVDGQTGYLVGIQDWVALANRIGMLLGDSARRQAMGRAGRIRAEEEFSTDRVVTQTLAVYEQLLRNADRVNKRSS